MTDISAFLESRTGKIVSYAPPGTGFSRGAYISEYAESWHQFLVWTNHLDDDALQARFNEIYEWCEAQKVRKPRCEFVGGLGHPINVLIGSKAKATLFKLTFGGAL